MSLARKVAKMVKSHVVLEGAICEVEEELKGKIGFRFSVVHQPSDGWCILKEETSDVALLSACMEAIEIEGFLSDDDYESCCI